MPLTYNHVKRESPNRDKEHPIRNLDMCYSPVTSTIRLSYIMDCICVLCPHLQLLTVSIANTFGS